MMRNDRNILLSVPAVMDREFDGCGFAPPPGALLASDPPATPLGSGGGTAHLLAEAWRRQSSGVPFQDWLDEGLRILIHGGGQSRRLPAYAPAGKLFIPIPAFRWALGERVDQTLVDIQLPLLERIADGAPSCSKAMVVSGDVLLRSEGALPQLPEADVILFGLWAQPEQAQHFGVMFCDREDHQRLVTFLQKPSPELTRRMAEDYMFMFDIGVWLLSARAIDLLMRRSGWDSGKEEFAGGVAANYDMYGEWGLHLGSKPKLHDDEFASLSVAVAPLPNGEFYHFGCSRDIIESTYQLQNLVRDQTRLGVMRGRMYASNFIQNSVYQASLRESENHTIWVENSEIPSGWSLSREHVVTGVPANDWQLDLSPGACLDFVPIGRGEYAIRHYHIDDTFKGQAEDENTRWMGAPLRKWFVDRGLNAEELAPAGSDIQQLPLFAVCDCSQPDTGKFIEWLLDPEPVADEVFAGCWLEARRMSARDLTAEANIDRIFSERRSRLLAGLKAMSSNARNSVFYRLDLEETARYFVEEDLELPPVLSGQENDPLTVLHDRIFRSVVDRARGGDSACEYESQAFGLLRDAIVQTVERRPADPVCGVLEDQIVWGRCPVRLDFAGGWTDTPPYCLEFGGSVVNAAVDLNGQPPIQAFVRRADEPVIVVRSIDLGIEERLSTFDDVGAYAELGSGFAIARAALALAGFHPRFSAKQHASLKEQLEEFGGGIELSMLCAVPKGSGLGTSSVLAITLLGTLADMLDLGWDFQELVRRTSALEQMLTSGGGWQDQIGGVLRGVKMIETSPGIEQRPRVRWLPKDFFDDPNFKDSMLLYYTGVTRVAHNILGEIVRGIFLNSSRRLAIVDDIKLNAEYTYEAIQRHKFDDFAESIRRSWELNKELDSGTNVPAVQAIIDLCGGQLAACKLLGAGGGGYMFMLAQSPEDAVWIRGALESNPPNRKARFVEFQVSESGLQVTRS